MGGTKGYRLISTDTQYDGDKRITTQVTAFDPSFYLSDDGISRIIDYDHLNDHGQGEIDVKLEDLSDFLEDDGDALSKDLYDHLKADFAAAKEAGQELLTYVLF